jgi:transglutaminase-like putative cysteine protease
MPVLTVRHVTTYRYKQSVSFGEHRLMFRPRDSYDQRLVGTELHITPAPSEISWVHDVFGNCVAKVRFNGRAKELRFECIIRLDHFAAEELQFQTAEYARTYPFSYGAEDMPDLLRLIEREYPDPSHELDRWARDFLRKEGPTPTHELLATMTHAIKRRFTYVARAESGVQAPLQTLKLGSGSCRDFALLMMEAVRSLGLAARFVSGYLYSPSRDRHGSGSGGNIGGGATHAWLEVFVPGDGWVEFDPTNGIVGNRDLIRVAVVRTPSQAVPLSGTWTGFPSDSLGMTVDVQVTSNESTIEQPVPMQRVAAGI